MLLEMLVFRSGRFIVGSVLFLYRMSFVLMKLLVAWMFVVLGGSGQRLTGSTSTGEPIAGGSDATEVCGCSFGWP